MTRTSRRRITIRLALTTLSVGMAVAAHAGQSMSTFQIRLKIRPSCKVSAPPANINLGSAAATSAAVNRTGSTTFKVNCSRKTPFYIGMRPSAANGGTNSGTGHMKGVTSGNADKVLYTLYSDAALTTVWGNTATSSSVGNGMAGTGAGMAPADAVKFTAYAQVTGADFRPDHYRDAVRVTVHY